MRAEGDRSQQEDYKYVHGRFKIPRDQSDTLFLIALLARIYGSPMVEIAPPAPLADSPRTVLACCRPVWVVRFFRC